MQWWRTVKIGASFALAFALFASVSARSANLEMVEATAQYDALIDVTGPYVQQAELGPPGPGQGSNYFGQAIAISGDRAVIGSYGDPDGGGAYVFVRDAASGRWIQEASLKSSLSIYSGDYFGSAVAISGDTIAVGAPYHKDFGASYKGEVFVFTRDPVTNTWKVTAEIPTPIDPSWFGGSIALEGDTLAVGAPAAAANRGAVIVFHRSAPTTWTQIAKFDSPCADGCNFGASLAISEPMGTGHRLIVGAPNKSNNTGASYVFSSSRDEGTWGTLPQELSAGSSAASGDFFGHSVAISGDRAAVGAPGYDGNGEGVVYPFVYDAVGAWLAQSPLQLNDRVRNDYFGESVALKNTTLVVGATGRDAPAIGSGGAYVYTSNAGTWNLQAALPGAGVGETLGESIALTNDSLLIGAPNATSDFYGRGRVAAYELTGGAWSTRPSLWALGDGQQEFGYAVALSGNTLVASAPRQSASSGGSGVATIFTRDDATGLWNPQIWLPQSCDPLILDDFLSGCGVALEGDTAIIGLPKTGLSQGSAYVYVRSAGIWHLQDSLIDPSGAANDQLGASVALSGNTAVLGAPKANGGKGEAIVFVRSGSTWSLQQRLIAPDGVANDEFGLTVALSRDTAIVGAPLKSAAKGSAYVFTRSGTTWTDVKTLTAPSPVTGDNFGASVAIFGGSALISAPSKKIGTNYYAGAVYSYVTPAWNAETSWASPAPADNIYFGSSIALRGNTAAIGALGANAAYTFTHVGSTWQLHGAASVGADRRWFGASVALSNNTIAIGAPGGSSSDSHSRAFVIVDTDLIFADGFD